MVKFTTQPMVTTIRKNLIGGRSWELSLAILCLKEPFAVEILEQRNIQESGWINLHRFASQTIEETSDAFDINAEIFL